ncbi:hypothetical protein BD408DRAFT_446774, partial [Parasitella parasitica]
MSVQKESDLEWDADVIEFWNATLQSYKTCHANETANHDDPDMISLDLVNKLPKKQTDIGENTASSVKMMIPETQAKETLTIPNKRKITVEEQEEEDEEREDNYEAQDKVVEENDESQQYPQQSSGKKPKYQYEYNQEEGSYNGHQSQYAQSFSTSALPPPPPPPLPPVPSQDNEALSNLIMAWYYAGYYTGLYQAKQR